MDSSNIWLEPSGKAPRRATPQQSRRWLIGVLAGAGVLGVLLLAAVIAVPLVFLSMLGDFAGFGGLAVGEVAPPLVAAGWVNGQPPGDLSGKVVVVEAWAPW